MKNNYTDLEHLELVAGRLAESGRDITANYGDWISVTFACASVGEQARQAYHTICSLYSGYKREECDEKFTNCLKSGNGTSGMEALSAGDIMHELNYRGFRGREYNANTIGKTMKKLQFECKKIRGQNKYLVSKIDYAQHNTDNKEDANQFVPEIF